MLPRMIERPRGTVTFLFTDIEGSTRILTAVGADRYGELLGAHQAIVRAAIAAHAGHEVDTQGDAFFVAFQRPADAAAAAADAQRALDAHPWSDGAAIRVRMAIHTAEATTTDHGYVGAGVHRTARICAAGHGGQVLVSLATHDLLLEERTAYEFVDLGEHRLKDFPDPQRIYQLAAPGLATGFPALRTGATRNDNLPADVTSFIGRERELADVRGLLGRHRLVSLVGVGGTGKTRLMLAVAAEAAGAHADGAWLVELATLREPGLVIEEVLRVLGVQQSPGRDAVTALLDHLRAKNLLLLLDNCEHLVDATAELTERLLNACRGLRVLTTSREPLGLSGEATYAVPPLGLPPVDRLDGIPDLDAVAGSEAVRLFVERATATQPSFALDEANARALVEICRHLDGIPLALELAAARVNILSPDEIAEGLADRFRLLTAGRRTAAARQQTLRALIDWSWDLLTESDQRLLRRLSVFRGGWTLEAAAAVTGDGADAAAPPSGSARLDTLDGLGRLVDRSLVAANHEGTTRYALLETIREYAHERLAASGEADALETRHLAQFRRLAVDAAPALEGPEMIEWLGRLDAEIDNLRAALDRAFETDPRAALEMSAALCAYWRARLTGSEGFDRTERAIELARAQVAASESAPAVDRAALAAVAARVLSGGLQLRASFTGRMPDAEIRDEALSMAQASGDMAVMAATAGTLAFAAVSVGGTIDPDGPDGAWAKEALELAEQQGDWLRASVIQGSFAFAISERDPRMAEEWLDRAGEAAERSGNPFVLGNLVRLRAALASAVGRLDEAAHLLREAQPLYRAMGDRRFERVLASELGHVLRRQGRLDDAEAEYRGTIRGWQASGNRGAVANQLECFAFIAADRGLGARAARLFGAAEALRAAANAPMTDAERIEYDAGVAQLREELDAESLASEWADGRRMTAEAAVAFALAAAPA